MITMLKVHMIWLQCVGGDCNLPEYAENNIESWRAIGYDVTIWNEDSINSLMEDHGRHDLIHVFRNTAPWVARLDLAKYIILYLIGGIYADMDTICLKHISPDFDEYRNNDVLFVSECDTIATSEFIQRAFGLDKLINSGIMVAPRPGNYILSTLLERIKKAHAILLESHLSTSVMTGLTYLRMVGPVDHVVSRY